MFIEPHPDDAALAAGHLMKSGALGSQVLILTVFGRTMFSERSPLALSAVRLASVLRLGVKDTFAHLSSRNTTGKTTCLCPYHTISRPDCAGMRYAGNPAGLLLLSLVTNIRRAEDDDFARLVGASRFDLGLLDHKFRVVFTTTGVEDPLTAKLERVVQCVSAILERLETKVTLLVAKWPYTERRHADHDLCFRLSCELSRRLGITLHLVDDIPYTRRPPEHEFVSEKTGVRYRARVYRMTKRNLEDKISMVRVFMSQPVESYLDFLAKPLPGDKEPSETLWIPKEA